MKAKLSIRSKITLWFSVALVIIVTITYLAVLAVSDQVIQKTIRDNLIETVEHNVDEVEFYNSIEEFDLLTDVDHFLQYNDGFLEIDDDFLNSVNQIYTALYNSDGFLMYGENPVAKDVSELKFSDSQVQRIDIDGIKYYVFDRKLSAKGVEGLWLRGVVSEEQGQTQMASISHTSLIILPLLVVFTIIGGYLIAGKALKPIRKISDSAEQISMGNDLKKRIEIGDGKDELHQLANNFNEMFDRLDNAFQVEKQFTSDASHELRTPVSVILAQCELTLESERTADEYIEALEVIERQGDKMSKLINDMLAFTRLELKADQYEKSEINLSELVNSICSDMALIRDKNITLNFNTEDSVICTGNRNLLARLISNLISNAYRYGNENGNIFVTLKKKNNKVILSVKDDGIGIAKEEQDKIFERFYQADSSHTGVGTGLGLAMVKEIARFHNGNISVESEIGEGSTFILEI